MTADDYEEVWADVLERYPFEDGSHKRRLSRSSTSTWTRSIEPG